MTADDIAGMVIVGLSGVLAAGAAWLLPAGDEVTAAAKRAEFVDRNGDGNGDGEE